MHVGLEKHIKHKNPCEELANKSKSVELYECESWTLNKVELKFLEIPRSGTEEK